MTPACTMTRMDHRPCLVSAHSFCAKCGDKHHNDDMSPITGLADLCPQCAAEQLAATLADTCWDDDDTLPGVDMSAIAMAGNEWGWHPPLSWSSCYAPGSSESCGGCDSCLELQRNYYASLAQ